MGVACLQRPKKLALLSVLSLGLPLSNVHTATFLVTTDSDSGAGSLRQAIVDANASGGGAITFSNATGTITLLSALPPITANTTIFGPGRNLLTISGSNQFRVFTFNSGSTSAVSDLTIANGSVTNDYGGGVFNAGVLTISNCAIVENYSMRGGGIYSSGNLTMLRASLSNNFAFGHSATDASSGENGWGGGGYFVGGETLISNCLFRMNYAIGGRGRDGWFPYSSSAGGAGLGGGVYLEGGLLVVANTIFAQNRASGGNGGYGGPHIGGSNGGDATGAGIFMSDGILVATNATFVGNYAAGGSGGGGYLSGGAGGTARGGGISLRKGRLIVTGSTLNNNNTRGGANAYGFRLGSGSPGQGLGGAIYADNGAALVLGNCTLSSNQAIAGDDLDHVPGGLGSGGGVYAGAGPIDMINCTVVSNSIVLRYYLDFGGGIDQRSSAFRILNCIVAGNLGTTNGTNITVASDAYGTFSSQGHNLIGDTNGASGFLATDLLNVSPHLGPLQDNGGPTLTHALPAGSLAIDAGTCFGAPGFDQRGFPRPAGGACDIGAYEFVGPSQITLSAEHNAQVQFLVTPNQSYPIQATTNFLQWQTVAAVPTNSNGVFLFEEASNLPMRFYRIVLEP